MGPAGSPALPAEEHADLYSSTHNKSDADTLNDFNMEDGITDEECSDMLIEYIWLPKIKREICRADLTGDEVFLCCMPRPEVPVDQMHSLQGTTHEDSGLYQVGRKLRT